MFTVLVTLKSSAYTNVYHRKQSPAGPKTGLEAPAPSPQMGIPGSNDAVMLTTAAKSPYSDDGWYDGRGEVMDELNDEEDWFALTDFSGTIALDAVLCRHCLMVPNEEINLATFSLKGCQMCGSSPEGAAIAGVSPIGHLPLLSPLPLHASTAEAAQMPATNGLPVPQLYARCGTCLVDRRCESCNAWLCENCYVSPDEMAEGLTKEECDEVYERVRPSHSSRPVPVNSQPNRADTLSGIRQMLMFALWGLVQVVPWYVNLERSSPIREGFLNTEAH